MRYHFPWIALVRIIWQYVKFVAKRLGRISDNVLEAEFKYVHWVQSCPGSVHFNCVVDECPMTFFLQNVTILPSEKLNSVPDKSLSQNSNAAQLVRSFTKTCFIYHFIVRGLSSPFFPKLRNQNTYHTSCRCMDAWFAKRSFSITAALLLGRALIWGGP